MQANIEHLQGVYTELKFWLSLIGALWAVFRGFNWVKEIRTNDLKHIHSGVESLQSDIKDQTASFVSAINNNTNELKELRSDIRTFTTAVVAQPHISRSVRAAKRKK